MRDYLAIDSGGYNHVNKNSLPSNCSIAGCFQEKLKWCSIEQIWLGIFSSVKQFAQVLMSHNIQSSGPFKALYNLLP